MFMREIGYTRTAIRDFRKLPKKDSERVRAKIAQYAEAPESLANNVTELTGTGGSKRLRVGNWRILFEETEMSVTIYRVRKRGEAYGP